MDLALPAYRAPARSLYGPWADVLLLGGGSLLAMLALSLMHLDTAGILVLSGVMLLLANFVNHPHFAYSYQMFYGAWGEVRSGALPPALQRRWWLAAVAVPVLLAAALGVGAYQSVNGKSLMLGVTLTLMGLLVGWHYVKQGFGMAMVDAAVKKRYWPAATRKALLWNAYACWGAAWVVGNTGALARQFWGVLAVPCPIPGELTVAVCLLAGAASVWCSLALYRCLRQWRTEGLGWREMPLAGLTAYVITLYVWLGLIGHTPAFALVIPFFHSLQYLTIVSRYKVNEAQAHQWRRRRLFLFAACGFVLGLLGFWLVPGWIDYLRTGHAPRYGKGVALGIACAWIFINVHHYFIDNVLWRQGNPKVKQFLFGA